MLQWNLCNPFEKEKSEIFENQKIPVKSFDDNFDRFVAGKRTRAIYKSGYDDHEGPHQFDTFDLIVIDRSKFHTGVSAAPNRLFIS